MNRNSLIQSICKDVIVASELFMENLDTVLLNGSDKPVFIQDLIEDIIILSSFNGFQITDKNLQSELVGIINNSQLSKAALDIQNSPDPLIDVSHDVFNNVAMKYHSFMSVKPKFYNEYEKNILTTSVPKLDARVRAEKFAGNSDFTQLHTSLRNMMFPTSMGRKHLTSGNCFFLLYIDCIVRYGNVKYTEIVTTEALKLGRCRNNEKTF